VVYADNINLMSRNINTIEKNTQVLLHVSKNNGLEVNLEKSKHMFISHNQTVGQNHNNSL
jgi:5-methylthioribose kinase